MTSPSPFKLLIPNEIVAKFKEKSQSVFDCDEGLDYFAEFQRCTKKLLNSIKIETNETLRKKLFRSMGYNTDKFCEWLYTTQDKSIYLAILNSKVSWFDSIENFRKAMRDTIEAHEVTCSMSSYSRRRNELKWKWRRMDTLINSKLVNATTFEASVIHNFNLQ